MYCLVRVKIPSSRIFIHRNKWLPLDTSLCIEMIIGYLKYNDLNVCLSILNSDILYFYESFQWYMNSRNGIDIITLKLSTERLILQCEEDDCPLNDRTFCLIIIYPAPSTSVY